MRSTSVLLALTLALVAVLLAGVPPLPNAAVAAQDSAAPAASGPSPSPDPSSTDSSTSTTSTTPTTTSTSTTPTTTSTTPTTTSTSSTPTTTSTTPTTTSTTPTTTSTSTTPTTTSTTPTTTSTSSTTSTTPTSTTTRPTTTSSRTSSTSSSTVPAGKKSSSNAGAIAGGVVGGLAGVAILSLLALWYYRSHRSNSGSFNPNSSMNGLFDSPSASAPAQSSSRVAAANDNGAGLSTSPSTAPLVGAGSVSRVESRASFDSISNDFVQARAPTALLPPMQQAPGISSADNAFGSQTSLGGLAAVTAGGAEIAAAPTRSASVRYSNTAASTAQGGSTNPSGVMYASTAGFVPASAAVGSNSTVMSPMSAVSPMQMPVAESFVTIAQFMPTQSDEIALSPGDVVEIQQRFEDGWAQAINVRTMEAGIIPMTVLSSQPISGGALKEKQG